MIGLALDWLDGAFWSVASSQLVIGLVGVVVVAALVVGYFPLLRFIPTLAEYARVARLVAFLAFGLLCALVDRRWADARAELAAARAEATQLKRDLAFTETQLANEKATAADAARLADESAQAATAAQEKVDTYAQWLASRSGVACTLDAADRERLLAIRPRRAVKPARAASSRL